MRIAYINHGRFPTEKAHGFQIAQVCDAMASLHHEVTLLCPSVANTIKDSPRTYYNLQNKLDVISLTADVRAPGFLRFVLSMIPYGRELEKYLAAHPKYLEPYEMLYLRSPFLLKAALHTKIPVIIELHSVPRFLRWYFARKLNKCTKIVCLTTPMRDALIRDGIHSDRIIIEADAVNLRRFESMPDKEIIRSLWRETVYLPTDRLIIGYVGSLVTRETLEKGVRELVQAIALLKNQKKKVFLWIAGGPERYEKEYRKEAENLGLTDRDIGFKGHIGTHFVPNFIAACDICVYPAPKTDHPYFLRDTSPLKLFEYLAAGRPIVCADLPPVRDVVDEKSVRFFEPGDSHDLAAAITDVLDHPEEAQKRAVEGKRIVQEHSWEKRMGRILQGFSDIV